ncbi:MAG TPA: DUF1684 domain-containing protein [Saprospiraceae bacterium]|nr:DUF1684 domain-containing protein [Saprospiraceae bacterium]
MWSKFFNRDTVNNINNSVPVSIFLFLFLVFHSNLTAQAEYEADIKKWRKDRLEKLTAPVSWTSLIGLHWLHDGIFTVGNGERDDVIIRDDELDENMFMIGTRDGEFKVFELKNSVLKDEEGKVLEGGDYLIINKKYQFGKYFFTLIQRGDKYGMRIWDTQSPIRFKYTELPYYPVDQKWIVKGKAIPQSNMTISVKNIMGMEIEQKVAALVEAKVGKDKFEFRVFEDDGRYYMVFGDLTNGNTTYGGGRYVYFDKEDHKGNVTIDFNKSYTPPCGFSQYTTCFLPLPENRFSFEVRAGEIFMDEDGVSQ